jgi:hypothetical protein
MMKKLSSGVDKTIVRILESSAKAQIRRRQIAEDSLAYYALTEAIVAYGKTLGLLTALQQRRPIQCRVQYGYSWRESFLPPERPANRIDGVGGAALRSS